MNDDLQYLTPEEREDYARYRRWQSDPQTTLGYAERKHMAAPVIATNGCCEGIHCLRLSGERPCRIEHCPLLAEEGATE